jgi:glycosyltransferase involved in cell wall biosynthesis
MPEVSVVIPAYNAARTIEAALDSVFAQTFRDFEIVVVDDGSTDDTAALVEERTGVTLLTQPNRGPAAARNLAIHRTSGRLVAFLDADDLWLPEKLERQVAYFSTHPETALVHTSVIVSDLPSVRCAAVIDDRGPSGPPSNRFAEIFHGDRDVNTLTAMVRREILDDVGGFNERRELHVEDWDLWLRIAARHPIGFLMAPSAIHRPGGSMSSANEKTFSGQLLVIAQTAPLCGAACSRHAGRPDQCVAVRQHLVYREMGYQRFWRGDTEGAREAFGRALELAPHDTRARWYLAAARSGRSWIAALRRVRHALGRDRRRSDHQSAAPPPNLIHDTAYRRTRRSVVAALHAVDDRLAHIGRDRVRVLFEAASPLSLAVFKPMFERLQRDPRLEFSMTSCDEAWDMRQMFADAGLTDRVVEPARASRMKFDAYVNTDFWSHTWVSRRVRRMHLFHGVAGKYDLDAPTSLAPEVASFDRLLFPNRDRLRRYAEAGLVDPSGPQAVLVGYPKVDCLVDGSLDRSRIAAALALDPRRPTVLYAPTWSPESSLNTHGEQIVAALSRLDVNVIVKLHDRSCDATSRGSGGVSWRERLAELCHTRRVHLAELADASQYMCVSDALVTDHSSVGFEFMLLDRPVVVIDCPSLLTHAHVNPDKARLLRSASSIVADPSGLSQAVLNSLSNPDTHRDQRRSVAARLFYRPGTATARAVEAFYEMLGLPLPEGNVVTQASMMAPVLPVPAKSS